MNELRKIVLLVATLNLAYFGVEFAVAVAIGSVSLFADSIDFLEDTSVNFLIAVALGWSARSRARLGMAVAGILLVPVASTLWTAWPDLIVGLGIFAINAGAGREVWTVARAEHREAQL